MPESRKRVKKTSVQVDRPSDAPKATQGEQTNPQWFLPVMLGLMILGLLWVVVYYLSSARFPIPDIHNWNLAIGFVFIIAGFGMTTQWK
ncbi:MAG: cell division protein CrgA [Cellulomonadaceae bacterium]|nr:cell division protein CrgA [Cellulomonadaceae bacterium]